MEKRNIYSSYQNMKITIEKIQDENEIDFEILESDRAILIPTA